MMSYGNSLKSIKKINKKIHNFDDKIIGATLAVTFVLILKHIEYFWSKKEKKKKHIEYFFHSSRIS